VQRTAFYFRARLRECGIGFFFALLLACLCSFPVSASNGVTANLLTPQAARNPSVIADFDGDHRMDLATFGAADLTGLSHLEKITVQFGIAEASAFSLSMPAAANRLWARDLDGDNDRDLVLETPFSVPLAVWINDGAGNFHEGNLDTFRFQLSHRDPRSLTSSVPLPVSGRAGECPRRSAVVSHFLGGDPERISASLILTPLQNVAAIQILHLCTRGPPLRS
jgi:hypothetical protein